MPLVRPIAARARGLLLAATLAVFMIAPTLGMGMAGSVEAAPKPTATPKPPTPTATPVPPARKAVVFLSGVCSSYLGPGTEDPTWNELKNALRDRGYVDSDFLTFSYNGRDPTTTKKDAWVPAPYSDMDPVNSTISGANRMLHNQLLVPYHKQFPNNPIVLVGHSMGGAVAFQELIQFAGAANYLDDVPLQALVTVDSPLHGAPGKAWESWLAANAQPCLADGEAAKQMTNWYEKANAHSMRDSDLAGAATSAAADHIRVYNVGNDHDCLWKLSNCGIPVLGGDDGVQFVTSPPIGNQHFDWVEPSCPLPPLADLSAVTTCLGLSHSAVLTRQLVPDGVPTIADDIGSQLTKPSTPTPTLRPTLTPTPTAASAGRVTVTGVITDALSHAPVAGAQIAFGNDGSCVGKNPSQITTGSTVTGADGRYTLVDGAPNVGPNTGGYVCLVPGLISFAVQTLPNGTLLFERSSETGFQLTAGVNTLDLKLPSLAVTNFVQIGTTCSAVVQAAGLFGSEVSGPVQFSAESSPVGDEYYPELFLTQDAAGTISPQTIAFTCPPANVRPYTIVARSVSPPEMATVATPIYTDQHSYRIAPWGGTFTIGSSTATPPQ